MTRPDWDAYFLTIAEAVATRADCTRSQVGAVIVDPSHHIVATGYNGTPPGDPRSCLRGDCPRGCDPDPTPDDYRDCIALHAEQNAVAHAHTSLAGCTIYLNGKPPCDMCAKLLAAAGIERVVWTGHAEKVNP